MTRDLTNPAPVSAAKSLFRADAKAKARNAAEARFKAYGLTAILIAVALLVVLVISILSSGLSAFKQTMITIPVYIDAKIVDPKGGAEAANLEKVTTLSYAKVIDASLTAALEKAGVDLGDAGKKEIAGLLSKEAPAQVRSQVLDNPALIGQTVVMNLLANGRVDGVLKGRVTLESAKLDSNITPAQVILAQRMEEAGILAKRFNWSFITAPDASELRPEAAGLGIAIVGSAYMMLIVLGLALPVGVAASIYLEEFAPQNWFTDLIEVNISNLAAVPSIVFGILGLAIFINYAGLPASSPIVGGLVLTLMTLPTIIIATRAALKAVPPSIREAALGVGASKMQAIFHHVLPLAMPGILTGTIIGLAQALGETAPLLLIGMVAFVRDFPAAPPEGMFDPAVALPVQVFNFTTRGDPAFVERASGAIIVLLAFLLFMNILAIFLRRRFERRW
ncbi:MAG TPA: phosphate ABC transporter permease PtsA [Rhodobacteraceae bacterium]|jgi:phosphate transport system permease protein|nr:phosphate ABC transporter permease PtsA [Paracoccaceae bacterium]